MTGSQLSNSSVQQQLWLVSPTTTRPFQRRRHCALTISLLDLSSDASAIALAQMGMRPTVAQLMHVSADVRSVNLLHPHNYALI
jgi:hypothetical protein